MLEHTFSFSVCVTHIHSHTRSSHWSVTELKINKLHDFKHNFLIFFQIGRVENLVRVSHEKYNIACARILEPHANKIVVNDDQTGVKCLRFLKEKQLGTATFLPLNLAKIRKPQHSLR